MKANGQGAASSPIFTLLPDNYIIKFLARNAETGRIGTYQAEFVVPNLNKELLRLPISSVVLSSQRVAMTDALANTGKNKQARAQIANPLIENGLKLIPSVTRVFSKSREMYVYLQAYQREALTTQPLATFVTFSRDGLSPIEIPAFVVRDGLDVKSNAVPIKLALRLDGIEPGEYLCQISVLEPNGQKAAFWQAPIRIVP